MVCLIIPGLNLSGPEHGQMRWLAQRDDCVLPDPGERSDPTRAHGSRKLELAIAAAPRAPALVGAAS